MPRALDSAWYIVVPNTYLMNECVSPPCRVVYLIQSEKFSSPWYTGRNGGSKRPGHFPATQAHEGKRWDLDPSLSDAKGHVLKILPLDAGMRPREHASGHPH